MEFDIRTTMVLTAIITLTLALCLGFSLRRSANPIGPAVRTWVAATALQPLAWLLLGLRGLVPDLLSIVLANVLLCLAYAGYPRALQKFAGVKASVNSLWLLALPISAVLILFTFVWPSLTARVVGVSLLIALFSLLSARAALRTSAAPRSMSCLITATTFVVAAALLLVRAAYEGFTPTPLHSAVQLTSMQALIFGYSALAPVIATFGFTLMCNDRGQAELRRLAATDPLTGVWNRRMLEQLARVQLATAKRLGSELSVVLIDADYFKKINDLHGHSVGDQVLCAMVGAIKLQLRPTDLIGRLGGEELLVVLPQTGRDEAMRIAERLRAAVAALSIAAGAEPIKLSISLGVVTTRDPDAAYRDLVQRADAAMYQAKRSGRNRSHAESPPAEAASQPRTANNNEQAVA